MKKIKDLIYDYNDIFVALLIIAVAGAIILWRVTNIMAYPDYLAGKEQTQTGEVDFSDVDLTPTNVDEFNENPDEISTETPGEDETGEQTPAEGQGQGGESAAQPDANGKITVEIEKGASASGVAKKLKEAGLIEDTQAFVDRVLELHLENGLKFGTYKIPEGSTIDEIIDILK